jgi:hypothetical protein
MSAKVLFNQTISKSMVRNKDISVIDKIMAVLETNPANSHGGIVLGFDYNDVSEEVFQIQEIRDWVRLVVDKYPYFLYYCENELFGTDQTIILCLSEIQGVTVKGENISQDEYIKKHGKLDKQTVRIETKNILKPIEVSVKAIIAYGLAKGIPDKALDVVNQIMSKWDKKLGINKWGNR